MCMVRSPKSIAGAVGLALGNAPYSDSDRTVMRNDFIIDTTIVYLSISV
ncbi:hypothetical protein GQR42_05260 [Microcystis aeruginosa FD4]|uniref:Uncharacterized protein n=1 Tax=Microcystis aeruginosa FD4 TaxID=2686288 RepID=A0A857D1Q7_MICAE|nr:hypothetical protein GQR42_05260 [Microcystis aeruginosa FD4]